ncbi:Hypothetical predicted protein, partial [Pelobates cultripes]
GPVISKDSCRWRKAAKKIRKSCQKTDHAGAALHLAQPNTVWCLLWPGQRGTGDYVAAVQHPLEAACAARHNKFQRLKHLKEKLVQPALHLTPMRNVFQKECVSEGDIVCRGKEDLCYTCISTWFYKGNVIHSSEKGCLDPKLCQDFFALISGAEDIETTVFTCT